MELNRVLIVARPVPGKVSTACRLAVKGSGSFTLRRKHARTVKLIVSELKALGIAFKVAGRDSLRNTASYDLIISVGGDGTFLAASHKAGDTPILGVNPDPKNSVGFFCLADVKNFKHIFARITSGAIGPRSVPLIETKIGTRKLPLLALNDVLFAGKSPAETARYRLTVGKRHEDQKSSGVWIAAGPGSTGAIGSAGGRRQNITSAKLQYLVREPYPIPGTSYGLTHGILGAGEPISIKSLMGHGTVYIDGHGHSYPVKWKEKVTCRISRKTLKVFI